MAKTKDKIIKQIRFKDGLEVITNSPYAEDHRSILSLAGTRCERGWWNE